MKQVSHQSVFANPLVYGLAVAISLMHIWFNTAGVFSTLWQNALHFAGFVLLASFIYPWKAKHDDARWLKILSFLLGGIGAFAAVYMIASENAIYARGVHLIKLEWILGSLLILSALEFTRRATGWIIPILIILALTYVGWWGDLISGVFKFGGLSTETILFRSIFGDDGLFGTIARISSTFVFMFILFGAFLVRSGAGEFIIDAARAISGRMIGGPGIVAVIASGLTGTISGSAVANTASTGVITIPLMKRAGFSPTFSAAVEASASTGGQLMPPIMGAGAFVMASYTQIPYTTIVSVSVLPAVLYFLTVFYFIRIEARKKAIEYVDEDAPNLMQVLRQGGPSFLLPIAVLIGLLVAGFTPTYAAAYSILAVIIASWLTPNRMGPKAILDALALGAKNMVMTAILLCTVGLLVNVVAMTGIGNTFSLMITSWAGNSLLLAIVLVALASLVLGMGLPVTAAYIVLGTLSAPALYNLITDSQIVQMIADGQVAESVKPIFMLANPEAVAQLVAPMSEAAANALYTTLPPELTSTLREQMLSRETLTLALLSAHMIIFWLSQDSNVTPPVCLTAFTAATIADSPAMRTGLESWKIAKGLYVVPLLFAYTAFLGGPWLEVIEIFIAAVFGLYAFTATLQGFLRAPLNLILRSVTAVAAVLLLWPAGIYIHLAGFVILTIAWLINGKHAVSEMSAEG